MNIAGFERTAPDSQFQDVQEYMFHRLPGFELDLNACGKAKTCEIRLYS
jgi:hypothetical protein